jgi:hypothetical protein
MKIKTVELQIHMLEAKMQINEKIFFAKRNAFNQAEKNSYLWLLLPVAGFVIGLRKNMALVTLTIGFVRTHFFNWIRSQVAYAITSALVK